MRFLLVFFTITFHGQVLHHEMISSQGATQKTTNGLIVKQTIGQKTLTGTSGSKYIVMQGFQQSAWGKYISSNAPEGIRTTTYPNPFVEAVNFQFSQVIAELITINIYDLSGRLIFEQKNKLNDTILTINLARLPSSEYLVRLQTTKFSYYTKIIKL